MKKESLIQMLKVLESIRIGCSVTDPAFKEEALRLIRLVDDIRAALDGNDDTTDSANQ